MNKDNNTPSTDMRIGLQHAQSALAQAFKHVDLAMDERCAGEDNPMLTAAFTVAASISFLAETMKESLSDVAAAIREQAMN
jgi:hypothetical protein